MERKITEYLLKWKNNPMKKGLVISGARQVGKTYSVEQFGRKNYRNYLRLDFSDKNIKDWKIFSGDLSADNIISNLTRRYPDFRIERGESLLFLDEIQLCEDARAAIKPLVNDGRLDVIASGSLLGIFGLRPLSTDDKWVTNSMEVFQNSIVDYDMMETLSMNPEDFEERKRQLLMKGRERVLPIGYEHILVMRPMDFEEYLWAMGLSRDTIDGIREHIRDRVPFHEATLDTLNEYFWRYVVTGGMPEVVGMSISDPNSFNDMREKQKELKDMYILDINRYTPSSIRMDTMNVYNSIPSQLNRTHTKFKFIDVDRKEGKGMREYLDPIMWLESAGIVTICDNLTEPVMPLEERTGKAFKLYRNDTGLLCADFDKGTVLSILEGDPKVNKGGITENTIANMILSCGMRPYYFERNRRVGESVDRIAVDFMVNMDGQLVAIEVKPGKSKASGPLRKLISDDRYSMYHVDRFFKFGLSNILVDEYGVEHYPLFAAAFMDSMYVHREHVFKKLPTELDL